MLLKMYFLLHVAFYVSRVLQLEHCFVCCCNVDPSKSRSKVLECCVMWCWRRMEEISLLILDIHRGINTDF
jgi:hypothetical protein